MITDRIHFLAKKIANIDEEEFKESQQGGGSSGGFVGKGKLTEYEGKSDSWILNQMDKGKVDRGIQLETDESGQLVIDGYKGREKLIATKIYNELRDA